MISISVRILYEHNREDLNLEILAGFNGLDRNIRIARIQKPGLALAGNAYHGVGMPHCIHSGERAAERIAAGLAAMATASRPDGGRPSGEPHRKES